MLLSLAIPATAPLITAPVPIFLTVMAIILLTPLVLSRLRIPHVIGLIVAGGGGGRHGLNPLGRGVGVGDIRRGGDFYFLIFAGL